MAKGNVKDVEVNVQESALEADIPFTDGKTAAERMGIPLKGLFKSSRIMLVQKKKNMIGDVKSDGTQDYYYTLSFSDTENLFTCTSGKVGDELQVMHIYDLGFDYIDKKLKLVDFSLIK